MATPTYAQCKLLNADYHVGARTDQVAQVSADSAQNAIAVLKIRGAGSGLSVNHDASDYISLIPPTTAAYPNAKIGSRCRVFGCADAETVTPTTYSEYVLTGDGWQEVQINGAISVFGSNGAYKASYSTIDLAVAALAGESVAGNGDGDILAIKNGSYTLSAACNITKAGVKIVGEGVVDIVGAVGADYCFKTVLGALTKTATVTLKNLNVIHTDDSAQIGLQIDNASATCRINVELENVSFETGGGNSIDIDRSDATSAVRMYVTGGVIEGAVNMVVASGDDRMRFNYVDVRGGVVTDAGDFDLEMFFMHCIILYHGISGGHNNQRCIYVNCVSATDANPNVYALVDGNTNQGSATDQIIGS